MKPRPNLILPVVLVIEDNPDDRVKIRWMLSRERRVDFHEASGAIEGMELWSRVKPDLVLLDLNLPDGRGEEVLRTARQNRWGDPLVVAVSELSLPDRVSKLTQEGVRGFLPKDKLTQELLSSAIEQVAERVRKRQVVADQQEKLDQACRELSSVVTECATALADLGRPVLQADRPPIRLLKGMLERRGSELEELSQALQAYADTTEVKHNHHCCWGEMRAALAPLLTGRVRLKSDVEDSATIAVACSDFVDLIRPLVENALRHDQRTETEIELVAELEGADFVLSLSNLHPGLSALWQLDSDQLFQLGRVVGDRSSGRLGQGLAGFAKRVRNSPLTVAVSLDPAEGFRLIVRAPQGPSTS